MDAKPPSSLGAKEGLEVDAVVLPRVVPFEVVGPSPPPLIFDVLAADAVVASVGSDVVRRVPVPGRLPLVVLPMATPAPVDGRVVPSVPVAVLRPPGSMTVSEPGVEGGREGL